MSVWIVLALITTVALSACGEDDPGERPVVLLVGDPSPSFYRLAPHCVPDFMTVIRSVAARRGDVYGGAFLTGDPFGQDWTVEGHFDEPAPPEIAGNSQLERAHRLRAAEELRPAVERLTRTRPTKSGSPVLEMLERAAEFRLDRVPSDASFALVVCTDLSAIGNGLDARRPIPQRVIDRLVGEWAPRLRGLRSSDWYYVGVGRSKPGSATDPRAVRQVGRMLRELADRIGANMRLIDIRLGTVFPLEATRGA